ncbi:hypothetical protein WJX74_007636 [Apatococcus lobatus]|uniref:DNA polymerase kappa n=1 Tax=Apatococcus lobatus TaxID=904363 RepID=A0AAW1QDJ0_9CHLO
MQEAASSVPPDPGPGQEQKQALAKQEAAGQQSQEQWRKMNTVFTNAKAGMAGVDKEHVQKVVYEMSKNSPHFKNEQRKQKQTDERLARMKQRAQNVSQTELAGLTRAMDAKVAHLETTRDLSRTWLTVDMDAFFAACEELDNPALKTQPMAVGGIGMISTANYVARKYGVRSAMPGFIARELCPQLVFAKPNFSKYSAASRASRVIFADYDAEFSAGSLDEAHLDVTDYCSQHGLTGAEVAEAIRRRMREEVKLTCSVGVGPNRLLSKVAADMNKPDGQYIVPPDLPSIKCFVAGLPIRKVPGVGKVAEQTLAAFGVTSCKGLLDQKGLLAALYSPVSMDFFLASGLALGQTRHSEPIADGEVGRKGISCERTFGPISKPIELEAKACELAEKLAEEMADEGLKGKTLTLKLKETTFELRTRAHTCPQYINSATDIRNVALRLLKAEMPIAIRLMGLRMSSFQEVRTLPGQRSLSAFIQQAAISSSGGGQQQQQHESAADPSLVFQQAVDAMPDDFQSSEDTGFADERDEPSYESIGAHASHHKGRASGHAGPSTGVAAHGGQKQPPAAVAPATKHGSGHAKPRSWECRVCTFADNPAHLLRCNMCDSRKGSHHFDAPAGSLAVSRNMQRGGTKHFDKPQQHSQSDASACLVSTQAQLQSEHVALPCNHKQLRNLGSAAGKEHILEHAGDWSGSFSARQHGAAGNAHENAAEAAVGTLMSGIEHASSEAGPPTEGSPSKDGAQDGHWQCPRCRQQILLALKPEHEDLHAAEDLQAEFNHSEDKWRESVAGPSVMPDNPAQQVIGDHATHGAGTRSNTRALAAAPGQKRKRPAGRATSQHGGIKSFMKSAA